MIHREKEKGLDVLNVIICLSSGTRKKKKNIQTVFKHKILIIEKGLDVLNVIICLNSGTRKKKKIIQTVFKHKIAIVERMKIINKTDWQRGILARLLKLCIAPKTLFTFTRKK